MRKRRFGLQKEFSAIFDGVWVPKRPRAKGPSDAPASEEQQQQQQQMKQIEQIISSMKCSKDFECFKSGFEKLCKVNVIGNGKVIECLPENRGGCEFRFSFLGRSFCKCELRYYIAKNLNK